MTYDISKKGIVERVYLYAKPSFLFIINIFFVVVWQLYNVKGLSLTGITTLVIAYSSFFLWYIRIVLRGRKYLPYGAEIIHTTLVTYCPKGKQELDLTDLVLTIELTTSYFISLILITPDRYLVLPLSTGYAFFSNGKKTLEGFYSIRDYIRELSPKYEKLVKSRYYKKKRVKINLPIEMFEWDINSPRVERYIRKNITSLVH